MPRKWEGMPNHTSHAPKDALFGAWMATAPPATILADSLFKYLDRGAYFLHAAFIIEQS